MNLSKSRNCWSCRTAQRACFAHPTESHTRGVDCLYENRSICEFISKDKKKKEDATLESKPARASPPYHTGGVERHLVESGAPVAHGAVGVAMRPENMKR